MGIFIMTIARIVCFTGLLMLSACGGTTQAENTSIAFATVDADNYSGIAAAKTTVVKDASAWSALWSEHKKNMMPPPALPAIDFSRQMVLGVFLGERPNGCYTVQIEKVTRADKKLTVEYREGIPPPNAICTQALTAPSHLVAVERSDDAVEFVKKM